MVDATSLEFGLKDVAIKAPALWGCRGILSDHPQFKPRFCLDVVWDRQDCKGEPAAREALVLKLNSGALLKFRKYIESAAFYASQDAITPVQKPLSFGGVVFEYLPRGGYLYVTAKLED